MIQLLPEASKLSSSFIRRAVTIPQSGKINKLLKPRTLCPWWAGRHARGQLVPALAYLLSRYTESVKSQAHMLAGLGATVPSAALAENFRTLPPKQPPRAPDCQLLQN